MTCPFFLPLFLFHFSGTPPWAAGYSQAKEQPKNKTSALQVSVGPISVYESSYWIEYQSQCWGVRLTAGTLDNIDSIMVSFNLFGLGEI